MVNRRMFLGATAAEVVGASAASAQDGPSNRLIVGVMGTGGRGTGLATAFQNQPGVEVGYVCDVDQAAVGRAADAVRKAGGRNVQAVADYRRVLDDKAVDVLVVATCNHWHAPAAITACSAGKHVYVEKPCSHNPREGELLVQAARRHRKMVQMGNQRRSWPKIIEAVEQVRSGAIGRAYFAQSWYLNQRPTVGRGREAPVPAGLNFDLWQGPAPRRPFRTNILPYHWHWYWHWGNGELGNNGIHMIDLCRWGLNVDAPTRVTSTGGRYRYEDDQETPDTNTVTYDFPGRKSIVWEGLSCNRMPPGHSADVVFLGERGSLRITGSNYTIYDPANKEVRTERGDGGDAIHFRNFLEAVRGNGRLNSEIEEGHKSTLLCHLGNIAYRVGRSLTCDPRDGRVQNDREAMRHWSREYEKGWEPRVG